MAPIQFQAICHNHEQIVNGFIQDITELGCELISAVQSPAPLFPKRTNVHLNLLNEKTGESINLKAKLTAVWRKDGTWAYRIRWNTLPEFFKKAG